MPVSAQSYTPNDSGITLPALEFLATDAGAALLHDATDLNDLTPAAITGLRERHPHAPREVVSAALTIARLQPKATAKFGLPFVWASPEALEQATSRTAAQWKARRFAGRGPVFDYCAGIGGDTLALAQVAPVTAIDLSPVRIEMLRRNLATAKVEAHAFCDDARARMKSLPPDALFHIDPARRSAGRRSSRYEDLIPGPDALAPLLAHKPGGAIKLSPAVDFATLPPGHLELISDHGVVVQAVLWTGALAETMPAGRTASVLEPSHQPFSFTAQPSDAELAQQFPNDAGYLYEIDGAITRARLAGPLLPQLNLQALTPDGGYAWGSELLRHPALVPFKLLRVLPHSQKRISECLRQMQKSARPGAIEVKCRGHLPGLDVNELQVQWSRESPTGHTVLLFPWHHKTWAAIAQRV